MRSIISLLKNILQKILELTRNVDKKVEIVRLWRNPNPSSRFGKQSVTLSDEIENYAFWFATYKYWYTHATIKSSGFFPVGEYASIDSSYDYNDSRNISIVGNQATIEEDIRVRTYGSTSTFQETGGIILVEIYGVKLGGGTN